MRYIERHEEFATHMGAMRDYQKVYGIKA